MDIRPEKAQPAAGGWSVSHEPAQAQACEPDRAPRRKPASRRL